MKTEQEKLGSSLQMQVNTQTREAQAEMLQSSRDLRSAEMD